MSDLRSKVKNHSQFFKNTFWQYLLQVIKYLLPLATLPYLTRVLTPSVYAVVSYTTSFMSFAQVFIEFGFNLSGTKQIAALSDNSKNEAGRIVGAVLEARIILCGVVGVVVVLLSTQISVLRDNQLYACLAYFAACGRALAPDFLFQGKEEMGPLTLRYLVSKGVSTLLTFVLVFGPDDLLWVPALDILASTIALAWSFNSAYKMFGIKPHFVNLSYVSMSIKSSTLYFVTNMSASALNGLTTLFVGVAISSATEIAFWSLAMNIINAIKQMYSPIVNSLYPHVVRTRNCRFVNKIALVSIPFVFLATGLVVALSKVILFVLGGPEYVAAAPLLSALAPMLLFSFYSSLFGWPVLGAMGMVPALTRNVLLSSAVNLCCLVCITLLLPGMVVPFAISRVLSEGLLCVMQLVSTQKLGKRSAV